MKDIRRHFVTILQGVGLGTAEIIPGVSGSTIALLLGIYDDFIELLYRGVSFVKICLFFVIRKASFQDVREAWWQIRWSFGILLALGMLVAIMTLSTLISYLLLTYPHFLFAGLIGLTPPTMYIVYKQIRRFSLKHLLITVITGLVLLSVFVIGEAAGGGAVTDPHPLHLFIGGMVAVSTMVLPGVSGSFMLLVLGLYNFAIGLVANARTGLTTDQLVSLGILFAGVVTGLFTTINLLKWAFDKIRSELMAFLLGLLTASWFVLWPFVVITGLENNKPSWDKVSPTAFSPLEVILISIIAVATAIIVYQLHAYADRQDQDSPKKDSGFDRL